MGHGKGGQRWRCEICSFRTDNHWEMEKHDCGRYLNAPKLIQFNSDEEKKFNAEILKLFIGKEPRKTRKRDSYARPNAKTERDKAHNKRGKHTHKKAKGGSQWMNLIWT